MKREERKTYEIDDVVEVRCDLCGKVAGKPGRCVGWGHGYDVEETWIEYRSGKQYPESGFRDVIAVDICPQCFCEKLVPWLIGQGADIRKEHIDM